MSSNRLIAVLAAIFAAVLLIAAPAAFAHHKDGHTKGGSAVSDHDGDADSDAGTAYTEDNDNDGVSNTPDPDGDSDNRHPSGKDKHAEGGNSGNQGNSESAPDEDGHGPERDYNGTDKPNGSGGMDIYDQDGNNGCGNDDDFEDDNEGWCGGKPKNDNGGGENPGSEDVDICHVENEESAVVMTIPEEELADHLAHGDIYPVPAGAPESCLETTGGGGGGGGDDDVLDDVLTRPASGSTSAGPSVLGTLITRPGAAVGSAVESAGALPFTGAALIPFAALGLGLIGGGTALVRRRTR